MAKIAYYQQRVSFTNVLFPFIVCNIKLLGNGLMTLHVFLSDLQTTLYFARSGPYSVQSTQRYQIEKAE